MSSQKEDAEKELIEACKQGDSYAFKRLYDQYKNKVYGLALRMTGNPEAAEDITQQVFMKVLASLLSFGHQARFSSWLFRLAMNTCLDHCRKERRIALVSMDQVPPADLESLRGSEPTDPSLREELTAAVEKALLKLSRKLRGVLLLKYVEGLSYAEIAEVLGCSVGTVSSRLNRSREILAQELKEFKDATTRR